LRRTQKIDVANKSEICANKKKENRVRDSRKRTLPSQSLLLPRLRTATPDTLALSLSPSLLSLDVLVDSCTLDEWEFLSVWMISVMIAFICKFALANLISLNPCTYY
jgi:hypothetical protein